MPNEKVEMEQEMNFSIINSLFGRLTGSYATEKNDEENEKLLNFDVLRHLIAISQIFNDLFNYVFYFNQQRIISSNNKILISISGGYFQDKLLVAKHVSLSSTMNSIEVGLNGVNALLTKMPNFQYTYPALNSSSDSRLEMMGSPIHYYYCCEYIYGIGMDKAIIKKDKSIVESWLREILTVLINSWNICRFTHGKLECRKIIIRNNVPILTSFWYSSYNKEMIGERVYVSDNEPYSYDEFNSLVEECVKITGYTHLRNIAKSDHANIQKNTFTLFPSPRYYPESAPLVNIVDLNIRLMFMTDNYHLTNVEYVYIDTINWLREIINNDDLQYNPDIFIVNLCTVFPHRFVNPMHAMINLKYIQDINVLVSTIETKYNNYITGHPSDADEQDDYDNYDDSHSSYDSDREHADLL